MSVVMANGQQVYDAQVRRPRVGVWTADLRVDVLDPIGSDVSLVLGARTLRGHLTRGREFAGAFQARVVGGAGGMTRAPTPRHYNGVTVGIVLSDVLRDVGEALSPTADAAVTGVSMGSWSTTAAPAGELVARLLAVAAPGAAWRVLDDGTIWVGNETWPDAAQDDTFQVLEERGEDGSLRAAVAAPSLDPGTTYQGRRVSMVLHDVPHQAGMETRAWFEDETPSPVGRMSASLDAIIRSVPGLFPYLGRWAARVVAQDGRTIHVVPLDPRAPDMGDVQLRGAAGDSVSGVVGGTVLVGWLGGDPRQAYAEGFDADSLPATRALGASGQVLVGGSDGADASVQAAFLEALEVYMDAIAGIADPSGLATSAYKAARAAAHGFASLKARVA